MSSRNFRAMLEAKWSDGKFVCVGLDPDVEKMPVHLRRQSYNLRGIIVAVSNFLARIVDETKDIVCAYKPNSAFFEGIMFGREILVDTINHIHRIAPDVPIILDAKRGDIGNTNGGYVRDTFDHLNVDAITVHPYLGQEAMQPFLDKKDKGILVLCRTSNKGADEFQNHGEGSLAGMLYEKVAARVASYWNTNGNCGLVVGATYPQELSDIRRLVGNLPILIPGIGAQGGDLEKAIMAGRNSRGNGMIINSSRGIIYASSGNDYAGAAQREALKLHKEIKRILGLSSVGT